MINDSDIGVYFFFLLPGDILSHAWKSEYLQILLYKNSHLQSQNSALLFSL